MKNEPIVHEKPYLPSASEGPENAYYLRSCAAVERVPAYASCLFKIGEYERGARSDIHRDCHTAMGQRACAAMGMREEERLQGVALYYFPRKPPQALHLSAKVTGDFGVRITNLTDPSLVPKDPKGSGNRFSGESSKPVPVAKSLDDHLTAATTGGFAEAISAAVAESSHPEPYKPQANAGPPPGDHPVDRMIAAAPIPIVMPTKPTRPPMLAGETPLQYARRLAASASASAPA